MPFKVLIVDDSTFFRKRLKEIIDSDSGLQVIGEAKDGREAVSKTALLRPDVITMDVEMPVMDGITAVKEIMASHPTPILMFSSLTYEGADATFRALEAGAVDFVPKNFEDIAHRREDAIKSLCASIKAVARSRIRGRLAAATARPTPSPAPAPGGAPAPTGVSQTTALGQYKKINAMLGHGQGVPAAARKFTFGDHKEETTGYKRSGRVHTIVAIGSSTGGPIALQTLIPKLPKLPVPIVVVQHMPASFTATFAQRLDNISQLHVVEATDGTILAPGTCYIAPGGKQMIFDRAGLKIRIRVINDVGRVAYNPCVDVSFASLNQFYAGKILAMILTGMGSDGCEGCRLMKKSGSVVWAQNEESCVVYGMPQAIVNAGLADLVLPLNDIAPSIVKEFK